MGEDIVNRRDLDLDRSGWFWRIILGLYDRKRGSRRRR